MASVNLNKEENINVAMATDAPINAKVQNINYIPSYRVAEEERRKNELERQAYFNEMQQRVDSGEFNGQDGQDGSNGKSLEYEWNGTELGVRLEGETNFTYTNLKGEQGEQGIQGEKGEKGEPGATQDLSLYATKEDVETAIGGVLNGSY